MGLISHIVGNINNDVDSMHSMLDQFFDHAKLFHIDQLSTYITCRCCGVVGDHFVQYFIDKWMLQEVMLDMGRNIYMRSDFTSELGRIRFM